jgi:hypothetical protein
MPSTDPISSSLDRLQPTQEGLDVLVVVELEF